MNIFEKQHSVVGAGMMLAMLCYPILLLTIKGGMSGVHILMLLASFWCLYVHSKKSIIDDWTGNDTKFAIAMASPMGAILLSQIAHGEFTASVYDGPLRFLCAIPIYMAIRSVNIQVITAVQYGFPLGALAALSIVLFGMGLKHDVYFNSGIFRVTSYFLDLIHFGNFALLLGLLSLVSINWFQRDRVWVLLLKMTGFVAGLYVSAQSGSRGGWVAIPIVLALLPILKWRKPHLVWIYLILTLLVLFVAYFGVGLVQTRVDDGYAELVAFMRGSEDSSIGVRLQHWKAALYLFKEHPVFGVGPTGVSQAIFNLQQQGIVTNQAALEGRGELHSDILASAARMGVLGLLSSLALYFVPIAIFAKFARSSSKVSKNSALIGICFVLCFFVFGLTVEIFSLKMASSFYGFTLAILMAATTSRYLDNDQD